VPEQLRKRELGRADRVLPGIWRLRLPLPWPGVPHVNAWAIESPDRAGITLVDTGINEDGAFEELERTLRLAGYRIGDVELLVCTHAHSDHYGLAAPIVEASGCALWMHPDHAHMSRAASDPERALERRIEVARQSGAPLEPLRRWAEERRDQTPGVAGVIEPDRELVTGVEVETGQGVWSVYETPGHAPSHVVLYQADKRLLLSGDHLLGRVSLYFDYGWTPDPVAEFLAGLDTVEGLGARLCLPGHGRPFADVGAHVAANRREIEERIGASLAALADAETTAFDLVPRVFGEDLDRMMMSWALTLMLCYLTHLERTGRVERVTSSDGPPELWRARGPTAARL
jgi:glyoxylase-like metal-dependent hydrolase (beta-lactamase superfamily II)